MVILWFISALSLIFGYRSNNPITSSLCLVVSLILVAPMLVCIVYSWYVYLIVVVYLSGVLVIVVYFASLSSFIYRSVKTTYVFIMLLTLYPFVLESFSSVNISFMYSSDQYLLVILLITSLLGLMLVASYFLSGSVAIRRF